MKILRRSADDVGMQIAPMVDITWIMIIFFMVTNEIVENEYEVPLELPVASAAVIPEEMAGRVIINVDSEGTYHIGSDPTDLAGLTAHLKRRLTEHPPLKVYLRADANTAAARTKEFYRACAEAGAIEVVLATFNSIR